uniref:Uncharacterized protein n=1 Tax=Kalanchoe fedtschenkoi TaxID=63787 RepID=A0A7N0V8H2_KALFE
MPQLFTSMPALNEAASYLTQTTSLITGCFTDYSDQYLFFLIERVCKTVRGSADDIGWLQHASEMPPVEDGTQRFDDILDSISHGVHRLPKTLVYLLVPGHFSNHRPLYLVNTKTSFSKMGLVCHRAKLHSEASVEKNAREIKNLSRKFSGDPTIYWPDLKDKVAGLALAQSPYCGSPIGTDTLRDGQLGDYVSVRKMWEILICKVIKVFLGRFNYEKRKESLSKHHFPRELPVVSFHTEAGITPAVLATLSHVAHAELPISAGESKKLLVVMPLGVAMAACAQLLQVRYGEKSDGLVTRRDAEEIRPCLDG